MIYKTQQNADEVHNDPRMCTADHIVWQARGGGHTPENVVAACFECNTRRHPPPQAIIDLDWPWLAELIEERTREVGFGPWGKLGRKIAREQSLSVG